MILYPAIDISEGKAVRLAQGGEHLMIIGPKARMVAGGTVPLTLTFAHAPAQSLVAPVRAAPAPNSMAGMGQ